MADIDFEHRYNTQEWDDRGYAPKELAAQMLGIPVKAIDVGHSKSGWLCSRNVRQVKINTMTSELGLSLRFEATMAYQGINRWITFTTIFHYRGDPASVRMFDVEFKDGDKSHLGTRFLSALIETCLSRNITKLSALPGNEGANYWLRSGAQIRPQPGKNYEKWKTTPIGYHILLQENAVMCFKMIEAGNFKLLKKSQDGSGNLIPCSADELEPIKQAVVRGYPSDIEAIALSNIYLDMPPGRPRNIGYWLLNNVGIPECQWNLTSRKTAQILRAYRGISITKIRHKLRTKQAQHAKAG